VLGDPGRQDRQREAAGDDEDDRGEVGDLVQVRATLPAEETAKFFPRRS
jgi:hypothetical protein